MMSSQDWMQGVQNAARELTELRAPDDAWERISARLDAGDVVLLPDTAASDGRWRPAAAAALLLLCAGVAAAVVPQTGLRAWIESRLGGSSSANSAAPPASVASAELMVPLAGGRVQVDITDASAPLRLRVRTGTADDLGVVAAGDAASARFVAGVGRLTIAGASGGEIILTLPQHAELVTIRVDGVLLLEARGAALTVLAPYADTVGAELILPIR